MALSARNSIICPQESGLHYLLVTGKNGPLSGRFSWHGMVWGLIAVPAGPVWELENEDAIDDVAELAAAPLSEEPFEPLPDDWPDDDAW